MNKLHHKIEYDAVVKFLIEVGERVRDRIRHSLIHQSIAERSSVAEECDEDTIFQIDRDVESIIEPLFEERAAELGGIVLIAEGIGEDGGVVFPKGTNESDAALRIIMDPIDGTRGIMYDKRSAFYLAGAAPNTGGVQSLLDVDAAVMVELPTSRSYLSDTFWAVRGGGAHRVTRNLFKNEDTQTKIAPSSAKTIIGGFGQISRFFPPAKEILAKIEDEMVDVILPEKPTGKAVLFNDQYISSGGQLYELLMGHDRFIADIRAALYRTLASRGEWTGMTCHPYDVSAHLIGSEAGIHITNVNGGELDSPMDTISDADWIGYANASIREEVEPVLQNILKKYGLI
ncbi:MAG: inositol monophosphatase family protein [Candidatus Hinthialibacter antarcticus]|nr:inositol monophosphatase family protein [Candidatus Hinthialibacter antarcticus]